MGEKERQELPVLRDDEIAAWRVQLPPRGFAASIVAELENEPVLLQLARQASPRVPRRKGWPVVAGVAAALVLTVCRGLAPTPAATDAAGGTVVSMDSGRVADVAAGEGQLQATVVPELLEPVRLPAPPPQTMPTDWPGSSGQPEAALVAMKESSEITADIKRMREPMMRLSKRMAASEPSKADILRMTRLGKWMARLGKRMAAFIELSDGELVVGGNVQCVTSDYGHDCPAGMH